jgi:hypothetical protein
MRSNVKKESQPRAPTLSRKSNAGAPCTTLSAKSIILHECRLSATIIEPDQPRPKILVSLGPEHRVASFGAFLAFCLGAIDACRLSFPAKTMLLVEPRERKSSGHDRR